MKLLCNLWIFGKVDLLVNLIITESEKLNPFQLFFFFFFTLNSFNGILYTINSSNPTIGQGNKNKRK